ncbi:MAG: hydantoinase B/oxoprolinase family protein [Gemmatimonadetes bacterium]|nr:hydantoinase B/oxoprolinase family protein [Gemmatimonadota bacterium]MCH8810244.1 hydantoinase B/oxoprolinase family protein [Gemmatimonadota bacterium]
MPDGRPTGRREPDAIALEVFRHLFTALTEEMGAALRRASFSPNIKERRDYSCALFSASGAPTAVGDHMPVHLGAMPMSVESALGELGPLDPGDVVCLNDPFRGGTHLPDITLISPVHDPDSGEPLGYVASRAHHSDVGGMSPGSMPLAQEIYQEGLRIPPIFLYREGVRQEGVWNLILANVRTPIERSGDLDAQLAALHAGAARLLAIVERRGTQATQAAMDALIVYADRLVEAGLAHIEPGEYEAEDFMEDDGFGTVDIPIRVKLVRHSDGLDIDFTGSSPQVTGGINAVRAITDSATRYTVRCIVEALLGETLPAGGGSMSMVKLTLPENSIVNASLPASVAGGNVETSQRITDVLFRAFASALPDLMPALSQGTMNNTTVGGVDPRTGANFAYYETVGGGMGAGPTGHGLSGVHTHMSNSLNTPIEALEHAYPFRVTEYSLRRESGGSGFHRGGDGLRRDLQLLCEGRVTLLSERRKRPPSGIRGGQDGSPGQNILIRDGVERPLPAKVTFSAEIGDVISIRSPGGGGWGSAEDL